MSPADLGIYLRQKRTAAKLSQLQVATQLGYSSPQYISNWERGISKPPVSSAKHVRKLVSLYNMSVDEYIDLILKNQRQALEKSLKDEL